MKRNSGHSETAKEKISAAMKATWARRKAERVAEKIAAPKSEPKKISISDYFLCRSKEKKDKPKAIIEILAPYKPPKGVVPDGIELAMDADMSSAAVAYAGMSIGMAIDEGTQFIGYPYLSELAQRPEYRKASEVLATEMTRKWIKFSAVGDADKSDRVEAIEKEFTRLKVQEHFKVCAMKDGFFGRCHLYLDLGTGNNPDELRTSIGTGKDETSRIKIQKGSLQRLKVIEPVWTYPTRYNSNDPLSQDWYKPSSWFVMGKELHATRLLTFIGREVPDLFKPSYNFGGLSLSQMMKPYVDNWLRTRQSVSDIVHAFTVFVLKTNMQTILSGGAGDDLLKRLDSFNSLRDNRGLMVLDNNTEDFTNVSASLAGLYELQAQAQEQMCSVTSTPSVKLLGIQPSGMNASSEGEMTCWRDWVRAMQENLFTPNLDRLLPIVELSLFGEIDPSIVYNYVPLEEPDETKRATIRKLNADTDAVLVQTGAISNQEVRQRIASDEDSPYAALDIDDMPEGSAEQTDEHLSALLKTALSDEQE
jgi:hypothetical protein